MKSTYGHDDNRHIILAVAEYLSIDKLNGKSLDQFTEILDAPPVSLRQLYLVLQNLKKIIYIYKDMESYGIWKDEINKLLLLDDLIDSFYLVSKSCIEEYTVGLNSDFDFVYTPYTVRNSLCRGLVQDFPFWSTLTHQCAKRKHFWRFYLLLAQLLLTYSAMRKLVDDDYLSVIMIPVFDSIRTLANDPQGKILSFLPSDLKLTPEQYLHSLRTMPKEYRFKTFEDVIGDALFLVNEELSSSRSENFELDEDILSVSDEDARQIDNGVQLATSSSSGGTGVRTGAAKGLARGNQSFRFAWSALSRGDLYALLEFLQSQLTTDDSSSRLLLNLMFWLGVDEHRLSQMRVDTYDNQDTGADFYDPTLQRLFVYTPYPLIKSNDSSRNDCVYGRDVWIDLPIPDYCDALLIEHVNRNSLKPGERLFNYRPSVISNRCKSCISKIRKASMTKVSQGSLMTLKRVQGHIPKELARIGQGDPAVSMLTNGVAQYLGNSRVHYLCLERQAIRSFYREVVDHVLAAAKLESGAA